MNKEFIIHTKMLEIVLWLFQKVNTFPHSLKEALIDTNPKSPILKHKDFLIK